MAKNIILEQCPKCLARCINHKTFTSTRVADYVNKRFIRYFRCGPIEKGQKHEEHEWQEKDPRPGESVLYPELGDDKNKKAKLAPMV